MRVGVFLPPWGAAATPDDFDRTAAAVEELGYDSLWVGDHVVFPLGVRSLYPYDESGRSPFDPRAPLYEPITLLGYLAARTSRVRLGTSVLVLPIRHPVLTAKMVAVVAALARNRLVIGVGAGWMREEFEALGGDFTSRGAVTDEWIAVFRHLFEGGSEDRFAGRHVRFGPLGFVPRPDPSPPILVGGNSWAALRRAARTGDGWHPLRRPPEWVAERASELHASLEREGRDPSSFSIVYRGALGNDATATLAAYRDAGVDEFVIEVPDADTDARIEVIASVSRVVR